MFSGGTKYGSKNYKIEQEMITVTNWVVSHEETV